MQNQARDDHHPLAAAVAAEEQQYHYEIEGAPWWMPINQDIEYQPGAAPDIDENNNIQNIDNVAIDPADDDVAYMDSVKVVVNDNPWLKRMASQKQKDSEEQRKYILSIEFQVNCRKYILFTSLLFFIVAATFVSSVYTKFYHLKGWSFNTAVGIILLYGIIIGFICSNMTKYGTRTLLALLNIYWLFAWITVIGLFGTACVYLYLFPNKFRTHCKEHNCEVTTQAIIFAECSLICTLILYVFMMLFYLQRIAQLVIIISNLRDYTLKYESRFFNRVCHKHMYRYLKGWKTFRRIISRYTGLRISDVLYCSCWFRKCRRNSSTTWRAKQQNQSSLKLSIDDLQKYSSMDDPQLDIDDNEEKKQNKKSGKKYQAVGGSSVDNNYNVYAPSYRRDKCCCYCESMYIHNYNSNADCGICYFCCRDCYQLCECREICRGCGECIRDICKGIGYCCNGANCDGCFCCLVYHVDNVGDCTGCCHACGGICGGCCKGGSCDGCDCKGCDGGGDGAAGVCMGIIVGVVCVILFLLPIIVFCLLAAPFWLLAQATVWKLNNKVPWIVVVFIFILYMIPPCAIWAIMWTAICLGNMSGTFMTVMCQIWSFFYTVYSSFH